MSERTSMPIIKSAKSIIPCIRWSLIAGHERQAMANHGQTLDHLASRGGISPAEAVAIIEDRRFHRMDPKEAEDRLFELMDSDNSGAPKASREGE